MPPDQEYDDGQQYAFELSGEQSGDHDGEQRWGKLNWNQRMTALGETIRTTPPPGYDMTQKWPTGRANHTQPAPHADFETHWGNNREWEISDPQALEHIPELINGSIGRVWPTIDKLGTDASYRGRGAHAAQSAASKAKPDDIVQVLTDYHTLVTRFKDATKTNWDWFVKNHAIYKYWMDTLDHVDASTTKVVDQLVKNKKQEVRNVFTEKANEALKNLHDYLVQFKYPEITFGDELSGDIPGLPSTAQPDLTSPNGGPSGGPSGDTGGTGGTPTPDIPDIPSVPAQSFTDQGVPEDASPQSSVPTEAAQAAQPAMNAAKDMAGQGANAAKGLANTGSKVANDLLSQLKPDQDGLPESSTLGASSGLTGLGATGGRAGGVAGGTTGVRTPSIRSLAGQLAAETGTGTSAARANAVTRGASVSTGATGAPGMTPAARSGGTAGNGGVFKAMKANRGVHQGQKIMPEQTTSVPVVQSPSADQEPATPVST